MANIASQIKRNRQTVVRTERNKSVRSEMKTRVKQALAAAESGADDVDERFRVAQAAIDTAASKGILHKRTAARKKSRLAQRIAEIA